MVRFGSSPAAVVAGGISDAAGQPPRLALVQLIVRDDAEPPLASAVASPDGRFSLSVGAPGLYFLRMAAVGCHGCRVPVVLEPGMDRFDLDVRLEPQVWKADRNDSPGPLGAAIDTVGIVGDWNGFDLISASLMLPQPDGTFIFRQEAKADTISYALTGITEGDGSVEGPQADYYVFDGQRGFRSVLRTRKGTVATIVFDPRAVPRSPMAGLPRFRFGPENRWAESLPGLDQQVEADVRARTRAAAEYDRTRGNLKGFQFDEARICTTLETAFLEAPGLPIRHFIIKCLEALDDTTRLDPGFCRAMVEALPVGSVLWGTAALSLQRILHSLPETEGDSLAERALRENPSRTVQAVAVERRLDRAVRAQDPTRVAQEARRLKASYAGVPETAETLRRYDPDRRIQPGRPAPAFKLVCTGSADSVSNRTIQGKYCLIDFWSTWCVPCVQEIPNLKSAYERFQSRDFTILSISLDAIPQVVTSFQAIRLKIPWLSVFSPGITDGATAKAFEVIALPKAVLVGPDGIIIEDGLTRPLQGPGLFQTLDAILPKAPQAGPAGTGSPSRAGWGTTK